MKNTAVQDTNFAEETTPNNEKIRKEIFDLSMIKPRADKHET